MSDHLEHGPLIVRSLVTLNRSSMALARLAQVISETAGPGTLQWRPAPD